MHCDFLNILFYFLSLGPQSGSTTYITWDDGPISISNLTYQVISPIPISSPAEQVISQIPMKDSSQKFVSPTTKIKSSHIFPNILMSSHDLLLPKLIYLFLHLQASSSVPSFYIRHPPFLPSTFIIIFPSYFAFTDLHLQASSLGSPSA